MKVLFAVVLTICSIADGKKVCHEEPGPAVYTTKAECLANVKAAELARNVPHDGNATQPGECRPNYVRSVQKPAPRQRRKMVRPVKAESRPEPQPTTLTATAELCGLRNGKKTRTCLNQAEDGFKDRSACIARAQELMKDNRLAFGYGRIPTPYEPRLRCVGTVTTEAAVPEAAEPIVPPVSDSQSQTDIPTETIQHPFNWTPIAAILILVALLGGAIFFRKHNENPAGDSKPAPARNPVVGVRRANRTTRGVKK